MVVKSDIAELYPLMHDAGEQLWKTDSAVQRFWRRRFCVAALYDALDIQRITPFHHWLVVKFSISVT